VAEPPVPLARCSREAEHLRVRELLEAGLVLAGESADEAAAVLTQKR